MSFAPGVCRVTGFLVAMRKLGVIKATTKKTAATSQIRLGATQTPCQLEPEGSKWTQFEELRSSVAHLPTCGGSALDIQEADHALDDGLRRCSWLSCGDQSQYVRPWIRRKILYAVLSSSDADSAAFWTGMTIKQLGAYVPDMTQQMKVFPDDALATDVVALFGLPPAVGPFLLPMIGCLWHGAYTAKPAIASEFCSWKMAPLYEQYCEQYSRREGVPPSPLTALKDMAASPEWLESISRARRGLESPRPSGQASAAADGVVKPEGPMASSVAAEGGGAGKAARKRVRAKAPEPPKKLPRLTAKAAAKVLPKPHKASAKAAPARAARSARVVGAKSRPKWMPQVAGRCRCRCRCLLFVGRCWLLFLSLTRCLFLLSLQLLLLPLLLLLRSWGLGRRRGWRQRGRR